MATTKDETFTIGELDAALKKTNFHHSHFPLIVGALHSARKPQPMKFTLKVEFRQEQRELLTPETAARSLQSILEAELGFFWSARNVTVTPVTEA